MTLPDPKPLASWADLRNEYEAKKSIWDGWLFRGQIPRQNIPALPALTTSLERAAVRFGIDLQQARRWEYRLVRDFKRRCHLVTGNLPDLHNDLEWLALLRHYGGPARLSDWTYSFWIGVHFAIESADPGDRCEIWCLNARWWRERIERRYPELKEVVTKYGSNSLEESRHVLSMEKSPGLWFLSPFRMNDRLAAQQGAFVLPLDVTKRFIDNLYAADPDNHGTAHVMRYELAMTEEFLSTCLTELHRMNINRIMLYPGITGLAQHYENALGLPHLFADIDDDLSASP